MVPAQSYAHLTAKKARKCGLCPGQPSAHLKFRSSFIEGKRVIDIEGQLAVLVIVFRDDFEFGNLTKSHLESESG